MLTDCARRCFLCLGGVWGLTLLCMWGGVATFSSTDGVWMTVPCSQLQTSGFGGKPLAVYQWPQPKEGEVYKDPESGSLSPILRIGNCSFDLGGSRWNGQYNFVFNAFARSTSKTGDVTLGEVQRVEEDGGAKLVAAGILKSGSSSSSRKIETVYESRYTGTHIELKGCSDKMRGNLQAGSFFIWVSPFLAFALLTPMLILVMWCIQGDKCGDTLPTLSFIGPAFGTLFFSTLGAFIFWTAPATIVQNYHWWAKELPICPGLIAAKPLAGVAMMKAWLFIVVGVPILALLLGMVAAMESAAGRLSVFCLGLLLVGCVYTFV